MVVQHNDLMKKLIEHSGPYREEAFYFVRDGLAFTAEQVHGPEPPSYRKVQEFIIESGLGLGELRRRYEARELPPDVVQAIDQAEGCDKLDRHVTGRELCWGLRDYALKRWGMLARTVLESWNVRCTVDFGRIVFGFIACDLMQKQPSDTVADFDGVFTFDEAFDAATRSSSFDDSAGGPID